MTRSPDLEPSPAPGSTPKIKDLRLVTPGLNHREQLQKHEQRNGILAIAPIPSGPLHRMHAVIPKPQITLPDIRPKSKSFDGSSSAFDQLDHSRSV